MTSRYATSPLSKPLSAPDGGSPSIADRVHVAAFGAIGWPWLLRSLSGGSRQSRAALLERLGLPESALPNLGSWKADAGFLTLIVDTILAAQPRMVVEFGAGASTLVAARALQMSGQGHLLSFDQDQAFTEANRSWLAEHDLHADIRAAPLVRAPGEWPGLWYDTPDLPARIDLLVIDGPPWSIHPFVRGAAESLFERVSMGGIVLLDDGARPGERVVARRWRARWPDIDFRLLKPGTKGTLVGIRQGRPGESERHKAEAYA